MSLFYKTITSNGDVSNDLKEIVTINSDHAQFVNFDIYPNPSKTKFLIKASHKEDSKSEYKTDFILMDAVLQKNCGQNRLMKNYLIIQKENQSAFIVPFLEP